MTCFSWSMRSTSSPTPPSSYSPGYFTPGGQKRSLNALPVSPAGRLLASGGLAGAPTAAAVARILLPGPERSRLDTPAYLDSLPAGASEVCRVGKALGPRDVWAVVQYVLSHTKVPPPKHAVIRPAQREPGKKKFTLRTG